MCTLSTLKKIEHEHSSVTIFYFDIAFIMCMILNTELKCIIIIFRTMEMPTSSLMQWILIKNKIEIWNNNSKCVNSKEQWKSRGL